MHILLWWTSRVTCLESIFPCLLREGIFFEVEICFVKNMPLSQHFLDLVLPWDLYLASETKWEPPRSGFRKSSVFFWWRQTDSGAWVFAPLHILRLCLEVTQLFWDFENKSRMLDCCEGKAGQSLHSPRIIRVAVPALSCQTLPFLREKNKHLTCLSNVNRICAIWSQV